MDPIKVNEIKDLDVLFVSYVKRGANKVDFLVKKNDDGSKPESNFIKDVKIIAKNEEKQLVYGVVYAPLEIDSQGDFMTAPEIEKTCHKFNEYYRLIDKDHNCIPGAGVVVESYISPSDISINGNIVKKGTWLLVTKAKDDVWAEIKKEDYNGYSMYGWARAKKEITMEDFNALYKSSDTDGISGNPEENKDKFNASINLTKDFIKELSNLENNDIFGYLYVLGDAIWQAQMKNESSEELKNEILISIDQFRSKVASMSFKTEKKASVITEKVSINKEETLMENEQIQKLVGEEIAKSVNEKFDKIEKAVSGLTTIPETMEALKKSFEDGQKSITDFEARILTIETAIKGMKEELLSSGVSDNGKSGDEGKKVKTEKPHSLMLGI